MKLKVCQKCVFFFILYFACRASPLERLPTPISRMQNAFWGSPRDRRKKGFLFSFFWNSVHFFLALSMTEGGLESFNLINIHQSFIGHGPLHVSCWHEWLNQALPFYMIWGEISYHLQMASIKIKWIQSKSDLFISLIGKFADKWHWAY